MSVPPDPGRQALEAKLREEWARLSSEAVKWNGMPVALRDALHEAAARLAALAAVPPSPPTVKHCSQKCWQEGECDGTCKTPPSPPVGSAEWAAQETPSPPLIEAEEEQ